MNELTEAMVKTIQAGAKKMTGANRRAFEAQAALDYLGGDSRLAETVFGWSRKTVRKGLKELRTGVVIPDLPRHAVRKTKEKNPQLAQAIRELVIHLDNGPELGSGRTQFIKRLVEFADKYDLRIRLVYYPPYPSKYNPIERCWGILALLLGDWALERHITRERGDCAELGKDDDLEGYPPGREIIGRRLRNRCTRSEESLPAISATPATLQGTP